MSGLIHPAEPYTGTFVTPVHPSEIKCHLLIVVTQDNVLELAGPVTDENLCLTLLAMATNKVKVLHRGGKLHDHAVLPS